MNIFMFHFGRSGSTVLTQSISQLENVIWHGEIFSGGTHMYNGFENSKFAAKKGNGIFQIDEFLEYITDSKYNFLSQIEEHNATYGCEIKGYHFEGELFRFTLDEALQSLNRQFSDAQFIFLRRRNALRRLVSMEIAKNKNVWHQKSSASTPNKIAIDFSDIKDTSLNFRGNILSVLENSKKIEQKYSQVICDYNGLELSYEDDIVENVYSAIQKTCSAFNIEYKDTIVELRKTNPQALSEIIINYDELSQILKGSMFEILLRV